jgi:sterol desaturase/sphingolipid hydroxylase (fatty acid hydroxylase superfamily)
MSEKNIEKLFGLVAALLVAVFTLGLSHSISTGFAGFWGGFPFMVITLFVLALVFYDYWDTTLRKKNGDNGSNGR